jgi:DUF1365 family protein
MALVTPPLTPQPAGQAEPLLVRGEVRHTRLRPARHGFNYPTLFVLLPMRALRARPAAALHRNQRAWFSFFDRDHGVGGDDALAWAEGLLSQEGIDDVDGEIWLQTYPRMAGYAFKPVSFWYCHRADGSLRAVLAEVNNTFGERHVYVLDGPDLRFGATLTAQKVFHVSPFCAVQGHYRFRFGRTADRVVARVEHGDSDGPLINTSVSGHLQVLDALSVRRACWSMPLLTWGVLSRIHWQALALWRKRVPFFRKPAPPAAWVSR